MNTQKINDIGHVLEHEINWDGISIHGNFEFSGDLEQHTEFDDANNTYYIEFLELENGSIVLSNMKDGQVHEGDKTYGVHFNYLDDMVELGSVNINTGFIVNEDLEYEDEDILKILYQTIEHLSEGFYEL